MFFITIIFQVLFFFLGRLSFSFFAPSVQIPFAPHPLTSFSTGEGWGEDGAEEVREEYLF